jgi:hypothetical protein
MKLQASLPESIQSIMSQNECDLKLKMMIEGEKSYETQIQFPEWNIVEMCELFNCIAFRMTVNCFFD